MKRLNFSRETSNGHLLEQGEAGAIGWISRFAGHFKQAISNFQLLGVGSGAVAKLVVFIWPLHQGTATSFQKGVI